MHASVVFEDGSKVMRASVDGSKVMHASVAL